MNQQWQNEEIIQKELLDQTLLAPYRYLSKIPGKEIRVQLAKAFNHWLNIPDDKLHIIAEVTQMLHNASLMIDDIEDNSSLRRGVPVAHNIFGVAQTINCANYVYFLGLEKALSLNHPAVTKIYTEQLLMLHQGQGLDIYWRDSYICPSEDEYNEMVLKKTGGLFRLAVRMMQLFSANQSDLTPLLDDIGLYFQIRDDLANLCSKEYEANKSFCDDVTEGKFSFPIVFGIQNSPAGDNQLMNILRQRTNNLEVKKYFVQLLDNVGAFKYTRTILSQLETRLIQHIASLGGNPHLMELIIRLREIYQQ